MQDKGHQLKEADWANLSTVGEIMSKKADRGDGDITRLDKMWLVTFKVRSKDTE